MDIHAARKEGIRQGKWRRLSQAEVGAERRDLDGAKIPYRSDFTLWKRIFAPGCLQPRVSCALSQPLAAFGGRLQGGGEILLSPSGSVENDQSDLVKKEQLYKKAIELCPTYAEAHNNLGDVYEWQGRFGEAVAQYQEAVRLMPNEPLSYLSLGDVYFKTNRLRRESMVRGGHQTPRRGL